MPGCTPLCGWATAAERSAPRLKWTGHVQRTTEGDARRTERERGSHAVNCRRRQTHLRRYAISPWPAREAAAPSVGWWAVVRPLIRLYWLVQLLVGHRFPGARPLRCGVCDGRLMLSAPAAVACGGCGGMGQMARRSRSSMPRRLPSGCCCTVAARSAIDRLPSTLMYGDGGVFLCGCGDCCWACCLSGSSAR